ncbi:MAG: pilus assembly protein TadC [Rhodospirillales bacterium CG15_BIG_FIL_POST_REV_8_21_14_020_66_15]|nr:MAG: pilus assembly protein TadC [Rhodospirillales bacterium CG15_BIG_FIL_POST_REV_8_21_14_020_66_15]
MSALDFIPGLGGADLITLMAGAAAGFAVYAVWSALLVRDPMARRIKGVGLHRDELRQAMLATQGNRARRRETTVDFMRRVAERLKLLKTRQADAITLRLAQAGYRSKDALIVYLFAKLALPFALGGIAVVLVYFSGLWAMTAMMKLFIAIAAVIAGAYAPEVFVANSRQKRQKAMQMGLPDALDLLVICTEAGLALDAALTRVARETGPACPELAEELGICSVELGFLPDRRQALDNLARRTDLPSIRGVVNTLQQTEKYGTPLSLSLRVLSTEFRNDRMMKAEEKAARLPATLTVPLIIFILPSLFVVLLGPAVLSAIDGLSGLK